MHEEWKPVVDYEGYYEVSNTGRVRNLGREGLYRGRWGPTITRFPAREMKISSTKTGYQYVALKRPNEKSIKYFVHRLVMRAFVGEFPSDKPQCNHIDGVKANNSVDNLEFSSCRENLRHCIDVLGKKRGEGNGMSKVTEDQVREIRRDGRLLRDVAADYGISLQAVWYIRKGRNWSHVTDLKKETA